MILVYVDYILLTGSDGDGIEKAKEYLKAQFVTKDMGRPRYFFGIEIAHSKHRIAFFSKYALDLLQETGRLGYKPVHTPMGTNADLLFEDTSQYSRPVGKLIYLTVMKSDIAYVVGLISQFMHKPRKIHWKAALRILPYIKRSPSNRVLYKKHGHL